MIENTFENFTEIKVRGLCQRSKFDSTYEVLNDERGYLGYKGLRNTKVSYNPKERLWKMYLVNNPNITAYSNASMDSLLMGMTNDIAHHHQN
jgi:hypothetical protein